MKQIFNTFGLILILSLFSTTHIFSTNARMIADINLQGDSSPRFPVVFNNELFFQANDGIHGKELWKMNTSNETELVYDLNIGETASNPSFLHVFNHKLYFYAKIDSNAYKVYEYDGTNPPSAIIDFNINEYIFNGLDGTMVNINNKLYFTTGNSIFEYDTTGQLIEICNNTNSMQPVFNNLICFNDKLYFKSSDHILFEYNGISVNQICVLGGFSISTATRPQVYNNNLYFMSGDNDNLWVFDGINSPQLASNNVQFIFYMTVFNNKLYFNGYNDQFGQEFWEYDGNISRLTYDIFSGREYSEPRGFTVFQDKLYFNATDGENGNEVWCYDGITDPYMIADINPTSYYYGSRPGSFIEFNNRLYFSAFDGTNGQELWVLCTPTYSNISDTACYEYITPSGQPITESGLYLDTIPNTFGGDSIISIELTITSSEIAGDINCNYIIEEGEIAGDFDRNGEINDNEICGDINGNAIIDNSEIIGDINGDGLITNDEVEGDLDADGISDELNETYIANKQASINLFPNPTKNDLNIDFKSSFTGNISVIEITGKTCYSIDVIDKNKIAINIKNLTTGSYKIQILNNQGTLNTFELLKQ